MRARLKPLDRQVMVITGASSGIGLATARLAAARGAKLVLAARSRHALRTLVDEIRSRGGEAVAVIADVASEDDVARIAEEARTAFGGFDTWVNNAALSAYGSCLEVSLDEMRRIMDTNFWGIVHGSRVACAQLRRTGGALINMGSVVSDRAVPLQGVYSASKHAIKGWTDSLRTELAFEDAPVSVTLIKPSAIGTPYAEHASNYFADQPSHTPPVYSPRSVAAAVLYAAEHPVREVTVGASGRLLSLASALAPRVIDRVMTRVILPAMHGRRPYVGRSTLFSPSEDLRERGEYPGVVRPSLYTTLVIHKGATLFGIASAVAVAGLWRARRTSAAL